MLDNMSDDTMAEAVKSVAPGETRSLRRITLERLPRIGKLGVDFDSSGALTHSVKAADISLASRWKNDCPLTGTVAEIKFLGLRDRLHGVGYEVAIPVSTSRSSRSPAGKRGLSSTPRSAKMRSCLFGFWTAEERGCSGNC
jgi:hypothetical protein